MIIKSVLFLYTMTLDGFLFLLSEAQVPKKWQNPKISHCQTAVRDSWERRRLQRACGSTAVCGTKQWNLRYFGTWIYWYTSSNKEHSKLWTSAEELPLKKTSIVQSFEKGVDHLFLGLTRYDLLCIKYLEKGRRRVSYRSLSIAASIKYVYWN